MSFFWRKKNVLVFFVGCVPVFIAFLQYREAKAVFDSRSLESCGKKLEKESIPNTLIAGILAQEDRNFFDHQGVDWREVRASAMANLKTLKIVRGASTIEMQVANLCYLYSQQERTALQRFLLKFKEAFIASWLSKKYPKEEILRAYLTHAPLSTYGVTGFADASRYYYKKELADLDYFQEWSLILTLRNRDYLNPEKADLQNLPKKVGAYLYNAAKAQVMLTEFLKDKIAALSFVKIRSDDFYVRKPAKAEDPKEHVKKE